MPAQCHPIFYCNCRVIYLSCEIIHLYEVIQYTCATLRILLLHRAVASLKRRHTTPSTVSQGATQNAGTTPSNLPTPSPGHQFDCCEIIYLHEVINITVSHICMISYPPTCHRPCYQLPLLASFHSPSLVSTVETGV